MARKQSKTKAKKPQVNAAKNKSTTAGKRQEQQPKAAGKSVSSKPATAERTAHVCSRLKKGKRRRAWTCSK